MPIEFLAAVPVVNNLDTFTLHRFKKQTPPTRESKVAQSPSAPRRSSLRNPSPQQKKQPKKQKKKSNNFFNFMTTPSTPIVNRVNKCICKKKFEMNDIVVECENKHVFHSDCIGEGTSQVCPTCEAPMKLEIDIEDKCEPQFERKRERSLKIVQFADVATEEGGSTRLNDIKTPTEFP